MGQAMVRRLLGAGHKVTVYNRTLDKVRGLEAAGAQLAATPRAAVAGAEIIFASVTDDDASRAVWLGADGALAADIPARTLVVEHSTMSYDWVMELSGKVQARGLRYFDCPVAGRPDAAQAGQLVIFGGGDKADLDEITPYLKAISKEIFHFGGVGAGTTFKLIYNLLGASQIAALAEALASLKAANIDLDTAARAISSGATGSPHVKRHAAFMAHDEHENPPAFTGKGRLKDSRYGVEIMEKLGQVTLTGRATVAVFQHMVDIGMAGAADSRVFEAVQVYAAGDKKVAR
jgi:3-hydroxyisobutyrate dehydrogenase